MESGKPKSESVESQVYHVLIVQLNCITVYRVKGNKKPFRWDSGGNLVKEGMGRVKETNEEYEALRTQEGKMPLLSLGLKAREKNREELKSDESWSLHRTVCCLAGATITSEQMPSCYSKK